MTRRRTTNRKWTDSLVISAINAREDVSYNVVKREDESLQKAGKRIYGSWRAAVEAAGREYPGSAKK